MKRSHSRIAASVVAAAALLYLALASFFVNPPQREKTEKRAQVRRAIIISLDGLDVRYLRKADEYGLKIPNLRRLMKDGVLAGVESVYPSVTYPNHTSIVTGARPARHGVVNNSIFVPPTEKQGESWYWFADQIKADTLWDASQRGGLKTALVSWPVSTGAGDWNVPEIWKKGKSPGDFPTTIAEIKKHARPAGLVEEIEKHDPDIYKNVTKDEGDDMRTRWAEYLVREKRPEVLLVHLFDLDHFEHDRGPFTPEAFAMLEKVDGYVGRIIAAAEQAGTLKETAVFIVSDHGFRTVSKTIQPAIILAQAGLLKMNSERDAGGEVREVVTDWRAFPHPSGGSCAIILRDKNDKEAHLRARVALEAFNVLHGGKLFRVVEASEVRRLGAFPDAAFVLEAAEGYSFDNKLTGAPIVDNERRGTHGYLPMPDDYRATFVASGLDIIKRGDLGTIHMTEVATAIAGSLGLTLRDAEAQAITNLSKRDRNR